MHQRRAHSESAEAGFTLVELIVAVAIIGLLVGVLLVSLSAVFRNARNVADQQAVRSLGFSSSQFREDMGFEVPLAFDGDPLRVDGPAVLDLGNIVGTTTGTAPVYRNDNVSPGVEFVAVYSRGEDRDFFRGGSDRLSVAGTGVGNDAVDPANPWQDARYSKFSLSIFLGGTLPASVDGVDGAGMNRPKADGSFFGVGADAATSRDRFSGYVDPTGSIQAVSNYVERAEFAEHGRNAPADDTALAQQRDARRYATALVDRYGRAYRYYRWEPGRNSRESAPGPERGLVAFPADLNIPAVLQDSLLAAKQFGLVGLEPSDPNDPRQVDATGGDTALRGSTGAIVGAGPNGLFGTEDIATLAAEFGEPPTGLSALEQALLRERARSDNVVEVLR